MQTFTTTVKMRPEKIVRDIVRLEIAALLRLALNGNTPFLQDLLANANPKEREWMRSEVKWMEEILRLRVAAQDEA